MHQRISLNNPAFAGRIKKFDTYQPTNRLSSREQNTTPKQNLKATNFKQSSSKVLPVHKQAFSAPVSYFKSSTYRTPIFGSQKVSTVSPAIVSSPSLESVAVEPRQVALTAVARAGINPIESQFDQTAKKFLFFFKSKPSRLQMAFYGFGISVFLFAGFVSIQTALTNHQAKEQINVLGARTQVQDVQGVGEGTGSEPAEVEVPARAVSEYKVNPEMPRYIRIPSLGVFARIKHTGLDKNGAVDAPKNINDASWYNESALPGSDTGSSLLLGHVSGWTAPGVFKKINQLKPGQRFEIEKGSGEKLNYEVVKSESIPLDSLNMASILSAVDNNSHDLKLMTCSGRYNREKDVFEERYVVYAKILRE